MIIDLIRKHYNIKKKCIKKYSFDQRELDAGFVQLQPEQKQNVKELIDCLKLKNDRILKRDILQSVQTMNRLKKEQIITKEINNLSITTKNGEVIEVHTI